MTKGQDPNDVPKWIRDVKVGIAEVIQTEYERDPKFKNRFSEFGLKIDKKTLDSLITPAFEIIESGKNKGLEVFFECNSATHFIPDLNEFLDDSLEQYSQHLVGKFGKTEMVVERGNIGPNTRYRTMTCRALTSRGAKELFSVGYIYRDEAPVAAGALKISIKPALIKEGGVLAKYLFYYLWDGVVLDGPRLSEFFTHKNEADGEDEESATVTSGPGEMSGTMNLRRLGLKVAHGKESFGNIGGYETLKESIKRDALYPLLYKDVYKKLEKNTSVNEPASSQGAILFYGPSGTGKTLMARVIANEEKINLIYLPLGKVFSKWISESSQKIDAVFDAVEAYSRKNGKTILFIDEMDAIGKRSGDDSDSADTEFRRTIDTFLTRLDGFSSDSTDGNLMVIGSTNDRNALDKAIRSRFGTEIEFPLPSKEDRVKITGLYAKQLSESELETIANATDGFSGRDLQTITQKAKRMAGQDIVEKKAKYKTPPFQYYMDAINGMSGRIKTKITGDAARSYS